MTERLNEMRLGTSAAAGIPPGVKLDQVRLPRLYIKGPTSIILYTALLIKSVLGTGRRYL
jgi:hypothetical protein